MRSLEQRRTMSLFNFVKSNVSILDVVNQYATLKKAGLYWKGTCPFHSEKTASFTVSPHREIYYCFGCHSGGDVISFMAKVENCSPLEAAKLLIDRYQLTPPENLTSELHVGGQAHEQDRKEYYALCKLVATWCHENMLKSVALMTYMQKRGFTKEAVIKFGIGYFPGGLPAIKQLLAYVQKQQFLATDLLEAHILSEGKSMLYSPFEERVVFPIKDHLGRHCGFGGRVYKVGDERPKYYNSKESEFFAKGSLVFGLDLAKKRMQESGYAFLVEGYTDCMAMVQYGYVNTVATLGTACTLDHLKQLARYCQQLYVVYDADKAGEQAMLRLTQLCWQVSLELKVILLPAKEDPASYLTKGYNLDQLIVQSKDIFVFFIDSLGSDFSSKHLGEKVVLIKKLIATINTIDDPLKRDILLQKAAKTLDIPLETIKNGLERSIDPRKKKEEPIVQSHESSEQDVGNQGSLKLEKTIFCAIMNNTDLFNNTNEKYLIEFFPGVLRDILKKLKQAKEQSNKVHFVDFFDQLSNAEKNYVSRILLEHEEEVQQQDFEQLIMQLHKKYWKVIVSNIKTKIAHAKNSGDAAQMTQIMQDFLELKQTMIRKNII
jgi:DNA primase